MNKMVRLMIIIGLGIHLAWSIDYRWEITYPYLEANGRRIASGETVAAMRVVFVDLNTGTVNTLVRFRVRPVTSLAQFTGVVHSLQFWWEKNGDDGLQTSGDSLLDTKLAASLPLQSSPTTYVSMNVHGGITLGTNETFYIVWALEDWTTPDDPTDRESGTRDGNWFGLTCQSSANDLLANPSTEVANSNWGGDHTIRYTVQSVDLPVVIRNLNPSVEEGVAFQINQNMFFPNFLAMSGSVASKAQRINDLTFSAAVFIPDDFIGDSLQQASFYVGWDNTVLELDTIRNGNIWSAAPLIIDDVNHGEVTTDSSSLNTSYVFFGRMIIGQPVGINNQSLATLDFRVIKPGISPLFIQAVDIWDQFGIRYHTFQTLQNNLTGATVQRDAWAKFTLGDLAGANSGQLTSGVGDSKVDASDISLFANYIFMGTGSANWYNRFDIGAEGFRDPEGLAAYDDTTNFYDLLIIGTNYHRSQKGRFNQKIVPRHQPLSARLKRRWLDDDRTRYGVELQLADVHDLLAAQVKLYYQATTGEFTGVQAGNLVSDRISDYLLIEAPPQPGVIDLNFLSLEEPLAGTGSLFNLTFACPAGVEPQVGLLVFDPCDPNAQRLDFRLDDHRIGLPDEFLLVYNYPNPFNAGTEIIFNIPVDSEGRYELSIYNLLGQPVRVIGDDYYYPGKYRVFWDGLNQTSQPVGSGIYWLKLTGAHTHRIHRLTLLR